MTREQAEALISAVVGLDKPLEAIALALELVQDQDEQNALKRGLGNIMALLYTDVMLPAVRQYPELDPDRE